MDYLDLERKRSGVEDISGKYKEGFVGFFRNSIGKVHENLNISFEIEEEKGFLWICDF